MSDLPRKAVSRTARLASLPLGFAGRTAVGFGKRVGGKPAEVVAAELQARTAEQLFKVLGELKGGAMKFGQALSIFEAAMPEEIAGPYRATLTKLQDAAPPMPASTVHKVLAAELGPRWRTAKFQSFDDTPAAAASIGQVHRARLARRPRGRGQGPVPRGRGRPCVSDLNQVSRVARVAAGWIPGIDIKPITRRAASRGWPRSSTTASRPQSQRAVRQGVRDDPDFVVPHVVVNSEHVIVSEWLDGTPLSPIMATRAPRSSATRAAQRYLEFLLVGPEPGRPAARRPPPRQLPADCPTAGSGIIDFGAVNRLPDGLPPEMGELSHARPRRRRRGTLADGLRREGFVKPGMEVDAEAAARVPRAVHRAAASRHVQVQPAVAARRVRSTSTTRASPSSSPG